MECRGLGLGCRVSGLGFRFVQGLGQAFGMFYLSPFSGLRGILLRVFLGQAVKFNLEFMGSSVN